MENLFSLNNIVQNEQLLKHRIFTELQLEVLKKKLQNKALNSNEQTYYYKYIKPKLKAMLAVAGISEMNITGEEHIIYSRISKATHIIKQLGKKHKNQRIMISGSFLFDEHHNDIDVFIFTKYRKQDYRKGKLHINFQNENSLDSMFFTSISKISVSNFHHMPRQEFRVELKTLLQEYEFLIKHILDGENCEQELRNFVLKILYLDSAVVPNPKQISVKVAKYLVRDSEFLSDNYINVLCLSYDEAELRRELTQRIKDYEKLSEDYVSARNILIYINTYKRVLELASRTSKGKNKPTAYARDKV